jgi:hypothetical protein
MKDSKYYIEKLSMIKHPEGGYFKENYRHERQLHVKDEIRSLVTSIYFLIEKDDASCFHRLKSDEIWYYHDGNPLSIVVISPEGQLEIHKLGLNIEALEKPQVLVAAGSIFGSFVEEDFALVGCMVAPGFEFEDFELFSRQQLMNWYPEHASFIKLLTKSS